MYSANIVKTGANLVVNYSGANAGKLEYQAGYDIQVVGYTVDYDADTNKLTAKIN